MESSSNERIETLALPFSTEKQRAVLGHVLVDEKFYSVVITRVRPEWFSEPLIYSIYKAIHKWQDRWKRQPSVEEILGSEDISKLSPQELTKVRSAIAMAKSSRDTYQAKPLLEEMEAWLKTRLIQLALPKAASCFNARKVEEAVEVLNRMVKDFHEARFLGDGQVFFKGTREEVLQQQTDRGRALTFGLSAMDRLIDPLSTSQGALMPGDMTVILAPTNVGKTSVMITAAVANIMKGKSVLFVSHEGRPEEIKSKFLRCIAGMNPEELLKGYLDPQVTDKLEQWEEFLDRFLVYVPLNKPGLTVEEVAATVSRYQDQRILATGKGFDLFVDDYPAKLTTATASGGHLQLRHIQEIVYNQFVQMGLYHGFHVLVAVQTNREGSKVNRKMGVFRNETRLLHMEDVMEAWGVMTAAATVISVNRTNRDAEMNKLTYLLCKSRQGDVGWAVVVNTDYGRCRIHSDKAGAFWYRGEEGLGDASADIMNAYKDQALPSEQVRFFQERQRGVMS